MNLLLKLSLVGMIAIPMAAAGATAATPAARTKTKPLAKMTAAPADWADSEVGTLESYIKETGAKTSSKESSVRSIANSSGLFDDIMSPQYKEFQKTFLSVQTAKEVDLLLSKLQENYESYPADLKLVAAQLIPLQAFKSFVWRATPVFQKNDKTRQELILQVIRVYGGMMSVSGSDSRWRPFFDYVTEPWGEYWGSPDRFSTESELQQYLATEVYSALLRAHTRTKKIKIGDGAVIWDNQLVFGNVAFADNLDRYKKITSNEQLALLAHQSKLLRDLAIAVAYNWKDTFAVRKKIAKHFGIDTVGFGTIEGVTRKEEVAIIKKYGDAFSCLPSVKEGCVVTKAWMARAYKHTKDYYHFGRMAWDRTKDAQTVDFAIIDPAVFRGHNRQIEIGFDMACMMLGDDCSYPKKMKSGYVTDVASPITKELIRVNANAFFTNPVTDLKLLLPVDFEEGKKNLRRGKDEYRNYFQGRAISWNKAVYEPIFPNLPSGSQVAQFTRILGEARGGFALGLGALAAFVR